MKFDAEKISESTVQRLSRYYRSLAAMEREGIRTVSSKDLAARDKLTPAQVRKDLSCFGSFGRRGLGYPVGQLRAQIQQILGLDRSWKVALIGVGNIGSALVTYKEFQRQGFDIVALFDVDMRKIGKKHKGLDVYDIRDFKKVAKEKEIELAILTIPADQAQDVANIICKANIRGILNFAPINLDVPENVVLRHENMAIELETVTYNLACHQLEQKLRL